MAQKGCEFMTIGEKIKLIRTFRNMKQQELGLALGFSESSADNRIAQYETNYRVPKKDALIKIAEILDVNKLNFISEASGSAEDIMQTFFWLEEDMFGVINLFQLTKNSQKNSDIAQNNVTYIDNDNWPASAPVGIYFKHRLVDNFMREWLVRQQELKVGEITRDEYFEWKLNWPYTCDDCGKFVPSRLWRK